MVNDKEQVKAMVTDVIRQVFLVEEREAGAGDIIGDFPKFELKAIKNRKVPMMVIHQDSEDEDLVLLPFKCLTVLLRHSLIFAVAREWAKKENEIRKEG